MSDSANVDLRAAFARLWPPSDWRDLNVVLAVSGGSDSVAMLRVATTVKLETGGRGELRVVHINHGLRPAEAAEDEAWLQALCLRLQMPLEVGHVEVAIHAAEEGDGWEAAARKARYEFLRQSAERFGARFVAVGHTADDQVETVVHRMIRGTGLTGMAGIPFVRPLSKAVTLIRPLMSVRRAQVLKYLSVLGQDFRVDRTNTDSCFTRNRIRHELIPTIRSQFNAQFDEQILRLAHQAEETQTMIAQLAAALSAGCVKASPSDIGSAAENLLIYRRELASHPIVLIREVCKLAWTNAGWPLQSMGFDQWQQLASLIKEGDKIAAVMFPSGIRAEQDVDTLRLHRQP